MSNVDINVDRRTDGQKIGRLYRTLLQAGAIKILCKRGEIAPKEQFLLFSTVFSIYLSMYLFQGPNYIMISRLSLSQTPRDSLKYFEIFVPLHIRFAEFRK